jgi:N-acetylglucosaminyldiphosphoundecaprenol N-acetyl-beta-D-mannosaminyltransferase
MSYRNEWRVRWQEVLSGLRIISHDAEVDGFLRALLSRNEPVTIGFVNAHVMNVAHSRDDLATQLGNMDYVLRDGVGMAILLRLLGRHPGQNLNGTDLIPKMLDRARGRRIGLFGTENPYLENAAAAICAQVGLAREDMVVDHGFHHESHYLELVRRHRPRFVVLGMGVPKQEAVASLLKSGLDFGCVIVAGGAIVDFYGGKVPRAPRWLRTMRMEWLYRLAREPKRLFGRYVIGNPLFLLRSLRYSVRSTGESRAAAPSRGPADWTERRSAKR